MKSGSGFARLEPMLSDQFWADFSAAERSEIEAGLKIRSLARGDVVYRPGDPPQGLYFLKEGLVGLVLVGAVSGREHLVRFFRRGHFFGHRALLSGEPYHAQAVALEPTQLQWIPTSKVRELLERKPALYRHFAQVLAIELRRCEVQHVQILENQIRGCIAGALVYLKDLHPTHRWTRQEIANFCASTVSTVIKTMAEFENEGLISQEGREFELLQREKLISLLDQD